MPWHNIALEGLIKQIIRLNTTLADGIAATHLTDNALAHVVIATQPALARSLDVTRSGKSTHL